MNITQLTPMARLILQGLKKSGNELCRGRAEMYLNPTDLDEANKIAEGEGSFMKACLKGDLDLAMLLGDNDNRTALMPLLKSTLEYIKIETE